MTALDGLSIAARMARKVEDCCGCSWAADLTETESQAVRATVQAMALSPPAARDFGGRAMCPADEYDDLDLRVEMIWHAFEEALSDMGVLEESRGWPLNPNDITGLASLLHLGEKVTAGVTVFGHRLELRATTDSHLGEDASGLVDLTATLVPVAY